MARVLFGSTRSFGRFRYMSAQVPQAEIRAAQHDVALVPIAEVGRLGDSTTSILLAPAHLLRELPKVKLEVGQATGVTEQACTRRLREPRSHLVTLMDAAILIPIWSRSGKRVRYGIARRD
jgi:hypothetical protein